MTDLAVKGVKVKEASRFLRLASTTIKNQALKSIAGSIDMNRSAILVANSLDVLQARNREIKESLIDRLALTEKRIDGMIQSCYDVAALSDPVGEIETTWIQKDGLNIQGKGSSRCHR
ncbi:MAG TPA: gamma-glutamyl-phosphate reductase, partial [Mesotoga sp.]|nr:gamma-glutamyl-phosphate reductase [Mesotoga sp.]